MKQNEQMAEHIKIGALGESLAVTWLQGQGYKIVERNYRKKWGEIDIIAKVKEKICFVEVKTVSYETKRELEESVPRETFRPEDNVHAAKLARLYRAIETWIGERKFTGEYYLNVVTVRMVPREKFAVVDLIENVFLE